jgi:hypothetical protein
MILIASIHHEIRMETAQLERKTLLAKQGLNSQFADVTSRNAWLNEEISRLEQVIQQRSSQVGYLMIILLYYVI